jgi:hypothetical protein
MQQWADPHVGTRSGDDPGRALHGGTSWRCIASNHRQDNDACLPSMPTLRGMVCWHVPYSHGAIVDIDILVAGKVTQHACPQHRTSSNRHPMLPGASCTRGRTHQHSVPVLSLPALSLELRPTTCPSANVCPTPAVCPATSYCS